MFRLIAITLFITFLTGCTVVEPIDRAALNEANRLAENQTASAAK